MLSKDTYFSNGQPHKLKATFHYPDGVDPRESRPTVIVGHGLGGSKDGPHVMESVGLITSAGYNVFAYNLRGAHPVTPDTSGLTPQNMINDVRCAAEFAAGHRSVDPDNIVALNFSYTAHGVLAYSAKPDSVKFKGIVANSTVVRPLEADMFQRALKKIGRLPAWRTFGYYTAPIGGHRCKLPYEVYTHFSDPKNDLVKNIAPNVACPVVLIHGTEDPLAPIDQIRELAGALTHKTLYEIQGAKHDMQGEHLTRAHQYNMDALDMMLGHSLRHTGFVARHDRQQQQHVA